MILDFQTPLEFWGEAVNTAAYLHQRMPNERLTRQDYRNGCISSSAHAQPGLARRDDHDGHKAPYDTPYEMLHFYARSKACMIVGYVHDSTRLWRIWDPKRAQHIKGSIGCYIDMENNTYRARNH